MACGRCGERRQQIGAAVKAVAAGNVQTAAGNLSEVARTLREDAGSVVRATSQRLAAAHARLKR